jgi:hypothetical protein
VCTALALMECAGRIESPAGRLPQWAGRNLAWIESASFPPSSSEQSFLTLVVGGSRLDRRPARFHPGGGMGVPPLWQGSRPGRPCPGSAACDARAACDSEARAAACGGSGAGARPRPRRRPPPPRLSSAPRLGKPAPAVAPLRRRYRFGQRAPDGSNDWFDYMPDSFRDLRLPSGSVTLLAQASGGARGGVAGWTDRGWGREPGRQGFSDVHRDFPWCAEGSIGAWCTKYLS